MSKTKTFNAREILDSRGKPTVEVTCLLSSGIMAAASVPSGASVGIHEALELRDGDSERYGGFGVLKAVSNVNNEINNFVQGKEFDQKSLDQGLINLDGTENKSRLGTNAILGVSLAFSRALAKEQGIELYQYIGNEVGNSDFRLPLPSLNIINGGKHADSGLDLQEFMIVPIGFDSFHRKIQAGSEVMFQLRKILSEKGLSVSVGDEGGFAPKLSSNEEALDLIVEAISKSGYSTHDIKIAIDSASSSFYSGAKYRLKISGEKKELDSSELISWYESLINKYPLIFIEDGLSEDDWEGFSLMTQKLGNRIKIVGDDLLVTNINRINKAIQNKSANSVLIKLNQIGTLTETIQAVEMTKKAGWAVFVSHRSGETTDDFIADLSVGVSCGFIKSGSLSRGERVSKYNRLLKIESILNKE